METLCLMIRMVGLEVWYTHILYVILNPLADKVGRCAMTG